MSVVEICLIWIISFIAFLLIMYISYKVSYKLGIKKALYRTTYILLCLIFAFLLAPVVNDKLFSANLSKINITLYYEEKSFYTLIDYIEEVIVHSEFLNDLYVYFPSLKDLLMDFPQVLFVPVVYVMLFVALLIVWMPLYFYLSYKRKRRILYEREDNKKHRVWAGILGCVQFIFLTSVLLSPINGLSRIYKNATSDTLDDENSSLCKEFSALNKYSTYCDALEMYNATLFYTIGGRDTISDYVFSALTRISYKDGYTSLSEEASLIIKGGVVLNQSGLFDSLSMNDSEMLLNYVLENELTEKDIDIIVDTLSNSKYSSDILIDLERLASATLNDLMQLFLEDESFYLDYSFIDEEDIVNEIKVILNALTVFSHSTLLDDLMKVKDIIIDYVEDFPENKKDDLTTFKFMLDMAEAVDLNQVELLGEYILESRIFNNVLPYLLNNCLKELGFNFVAATSDYLDQFYNIMDFMKLVKKYKPADFFDLMLAIDEEETLLLAEIIDYVIHSPDSRGFVKYMLNEIFKGIGLESYTPSEFLNIKDWSKEIYVLKDICVLAKKVRYGGSVELFEITSLLNKHEGSEMYNIFINLGKQNISYFMQQLILELAK